MHTIVKGIKNIFRAISYCLVWDVVAPKLSPGIKLLTTRNRAAEGTRMEMLHFKWRPNARRTHKHTRLSCA